MRKKLVIANRGEIARRILRAARERFYEVAVICTVEDSDSLICREVDTVLTVSHFLNAEEIVEKSKEWHADLLHPGYGFLSENAHFAKLVELAKIIFVGPTSENMLKMGNKESAKNIALKCKIPTLNALFSEELKHIPKLQWESELRKRHIYPPYLVKASGGGGGRGMRIVERQEDLSAAIHRASEEAQAAFHNSAVFIESYLIDPRHIEIQIFGDGLGGGVFLGERECSLQRRHQKIIEEAPSTVVSNELRKKMGLVSLELVRVTKYQGAGTLEFLLDKNKNFYFLEMNTRLQVEHPVTELIYDIDLVHAQLDLAEGYWPKKLSDPNVFSIPKLRGVAIEARILAEDTQHQFLPTPGSISVYKEPLGLGVRVDSGVTQGTRVNANFDSMIAKLIIHAETRAQAIQKLEASLKSFIILGCITNLAFLRSIVLQDDFLYGIESTTWIEKHLKKLNQSYLPKKFVDFLTSRSFVELLFKRVSNDTTSHALTEIFSRQNLPKVSLTENNFKHFRLIRTATFDFILSGFLKVFLEETDVKVTNYLQSLNSSQELSIHLSAARISAHKIHLRLLGEDFLLEDIRYRSHIRAIEEHSQQEVRAPMAGKVYDVFIQEGQEIEAGELLFVVESMKMQLEVKAYAKGIIQSVFVKKGQILLGPDLMCVIM